MSTHPTLRRELFQKVAVEQLRTRAAGVLRGTHTGVVTVCQQFLNDCAIITEAILEASDQFGNKPAVATEPALLKE